MGFQLQHSLLVWLFVAIPFFLLLFVAYKQWRKKVIKQIGDAQLVQKLTGNYSSAKSRFKFLLLLLAFAAGVTAAINPRRPAKGESITRKGIDIAIALDVSNSMLATDVAPNRLEKAKQLINKLVQELKNDRIALVLFAGKAYLQMPLTTDHNAASLFVASASPEAIPQQGTVLSEAMQMSANAFSATANQYKAVVLITDGEGHDEEAIDMAKKMAEQAMMINAVGIGSPEGTTLAGKQPGEVKKDEAGNIVISKLNESLLKEIAAATNGTYVQLQKTEQAVEQIKKQLAQIDKKALTDTNQLSYKNYYGWLAVFMLGLLLVELFISERKKLNHKPVTA